MILNYLLSSHFCLFTCRSHLRVICNQLYLVMLQRCTKSFRWRKWDLYYKTNNLNIFQIDEKGIAFSATNEAIKSLSRQGYDPQFGARPIKRVIQRKVLNELSKEILAGKITSESSILLDAFDDELVFRNKK